MGGHGALYVEVGGDRVVGDGVGGVGDEEFYDVLEFGWFSDVVSGEYVFVDDVGDELCGEVFGVVERGFWHASEGEVFLEFFGEERFFLGGVAFGGWLDVVGFEVFGEGEGVEFYVGVASGEVSA